VVRTDIPLRFAGRKRKERKLGNPRRPHDKREKRGEGGKEGSFAPCVICRGKKEKKKRKRDRSSIFLKRGKREKILDSA